MPCCEFLKCYIDMSFVCLSDGEEVVARNRISGTGRNTDLFSRRLIWFDSGSIWDPAWFHKKVIQLLPIVP
jgi:hypothetical protein